MVFCWMKLLHAVWSLGICGFCQRSMSCHVVSLYRSRENVLRRVFVSEFLLVTSDCVHLSVSLSWIRNVTRWRGCKPHARFALISFIKSLHTVHDRN